MPFDYEYIGPDDDDDDDEDDDWEDDDWEDDWDEDEWYKVDNLVDSSLLSIPFHRKLGSI